MIDKEKVKIMTREAMLEKKNKKHGLPAQNFFMDDYISLQVIKGVIGTTLLYAVGVAVWLLYTMDSWINSYSLIQVWDVVIRLGILYLVILVISVAILIMVYSLKYFRAGRLLKEQQYYLKKLSRYYENEEKKRGE
ncbi:MAG: hypothetical protein PUB22_09580 [Clostridiales bacterium]|nr:hypothetical protein [Clostridiales bacterium]